MPLVSVVIPTYNRSAWVREAVASVLAQTYRDFELIVVDDGSTDDTREALRRFDSQIIPVFLPRSGVSAARNEGVRQSRGSLIAFLDSDDLWLPEKLEVQVAYMEAHSGIAVCQTDEMWIRNGRRVNPKKYHLKQGGDIFGISLERCMISPSAVMLRKTLFNAVGGFDPTMEACEDYDLWLRITCRLPVGLIPQALTVKRGGHADQLSRTVPALDRYRILSIAKLLESAVLSDEQASLARRELARKARIYIEGCEKRGKKEEASTLASRLRGLLEGV